MNRTCGLVARKTLVSLTVLTGLLGVAGCNGGNAGTQSPPESVAQTSGTPTPKPTSTAYAPASKDHPARNVPKPVMPEVAKQHTKEGWEAFAKYYIEELNYMVETNDPSRVKAISVKGCDFCRVETTYAQVLTDNGQWILNGRYSLGKIDALMAPDRDGNIGGVIAVSHQDASITSTNGVLGTAPGIGESVWYLQLQPTETGWLVYQFGETK